MLIFFKFKVHENLKVFWEFFEETRLVDFALKIVNNP